MLLLDLKKKEMQPLSLKIFSPAKINLFFSVVDIASNGYSHVLSLISTISFFDEMWVEEAHVKDEMESGNESISRENNTIRMALKIFREMSGVDHFWRVNLKKNIPIGGGLGGGSGNGAILLKMLNDAYGSPLTSACLQEAVQKIGADAALFLSSSPVVVEGIGEVCLQSTLNLHHLNAYTLLLFQYKESIKTKEAYACLRSRFKEVYRGEDWARRSLLKLEQAIQNKQEVLPLYNAFEGLFLEKFPEMKICFKDLRAKKLNPCLTGSGSCFFCLIPKNKEMLMKKTDAIEMVKDYGNVRYCGEYFFK